MERATARLDRKTTNPNLTANVGSINPKTNRSFANEYSILNLKREGADALNYFNLELLAKKKSQRVLPSIELQNRKLIEGLKNKIQTLQQRIKQRASHTIQPNTSLENNLYYLSPSPSPYAYYPPIPYRHYPPYPQHSYCSECHPHPAPPPTSSKHKKKRKKSKKIKKEVTPVQKIEEPRPKKTNRFRIYGFVIYFCLYFREFVKKFTENRRNWFIQRYYDAQKGIIFQGSEAVLKKLHQLDFPKICQESKSTTPIIGKQQPTTNWQQYTNTALVPSSTISNPPSTPQSKTQYLINLTMNLLNCYAQIVLDDNFLKEYHQVFSAGSLDLGFMVDNLYLPEELPFLFVHPAKGYLRVSYAEEVQILLIKVMVKMFIYNYLLSVWKVRAWNRRLQVECKLPHYQIQQLWQIMRTVAVYLYSICRQLYIQGIQNLNHQSNFHIVYKKFSIHPAKHLEQMHTQKIKKQRDDKKGGNGGNGRKFQLIANIRNYDVIYDKLVQSQRLMIYKDVVKERILAILGDLHAKLKVEERAFFMFIRNMTLAVPYLVSTSAKIRKEEAERKERQMKVLKQQEKKSAPWHQLYAQSTQTQNSRTKKMPKLNLPSTKKSVRFKTSQNQNQSTILTQKQQNLNPRTILQKTAHNLKSSQSSSKMQTSSNYNLKNPTHYNKSEQMRNAFNVVTMNDKFDKFREDRLRQKFKNMFANKGG